MGTGFLLEALYHRFRLVPQSGRNQVGSTMSLTVADQELRTSLRQVPINTRVKYTDWRGDTGEGTLLRFVDCNGKEVPSNQWGTTRFDGMVVKRDFSADDGRVLLPLLGDGDSLTPVKDDRNRNYLPNGCQTKRFGR